MVFCIVIAGESQCNLFSQVCLLANYLEQNLENFHYKRIEKSVLDWKPWLCDTNITNGWHHTISPIVWKELLNDGSKPMYIGSAQEFLEYCYSYYNFEIFLAAEKFENLPQNYIQFIRNNKKNNISQKSHLLDDINKSEESLTHYTICISGAYSYLTMYLVSELLELHTGVHKISKIYIFDINCSTNFVNLVERECSFIQKIHTGKVVKLAEKIGIALTKTNILVILDHVPFREDLSIGEWLNSNKKIMEEIASTINICGSSNMRIIFPNLGPACYNATILANRVTNIKKKNIVVATSDLGMDVAAFISEIAKIPLYNIFCPPVWGFVGINQLIDVKSTIHRYDAFTPLDRYTKVRNSTLCVGTITPEMRTMEYILYFDENFWKRFAEKSKFNKKKYLNKAIAVVNIIKIWLCDPNPDYVVNLGIICDGSFGLSFKGIFSQPAQLLDGEWRPAKLHPLPRDSQLNIYYLQDMANKILELSEGDLPQIIEYTPCTCRCISKE